MRISERCGRAAVLAVLLSLAACSQPTSNLPKGETIACAIDGSPNFAHVCTVERKGPRLVVHRPDGGFRQFEVTPNGAVTARDGADAAQAIAVTNGMVEAQIDGDRYRFRLKAAGDAPKP